jgi:hypothetical protein
VRQLAQSLLGVALRFSDGTRAPMPPDLRAALGNTDHPRRHGPQQRFTPIHSPPGCRRPIISPTRNQPPAR